MIHAEDFEPGESLYGYFNRLAVLRDWPSHRRFHEDFGIGFDDGPIPASALGRIADHSNCAPEAIASTFWCGDERIRRLGAIQVPAWMVCRQITRFCPSCVWEGKSHQTAWDFAPLPACPVHKTPLVGTCQVCGSPLSRRRPWFHLCHHCGLPITSYTLKVAKSDAAAVRISSAIIAHLDKSSRELEGRYPPDICQLDLANFLLMARLVGTMAHDQEVAYRPRRSWLLEDAVRAAFGARLLERWPVAFRRLLRRRTSRSDRPMPLFVPAVQRLVTLRFRHEGHLPYAQLIAGEFWQHALSNGVILPPGTYGHTPKGFDESFISHKEAIKRSGLTRRKLAELARKQGWLGSRQLGSRCPIWFRIAHIDALSVDLNAHIYLIQAAIFLGCSTTCLRRLIKLGHFPSSDIDFHDKRSTWHTTAAEIEAFKARLREKIVDLSPGHATTWRRFSRQHGKCFSLHGDAVVAVIEGKVPLVSWPSDRIWDLKFDAQALEAFIEGISTSSSTSIENLARESGIPETVIAHALKVGLLRRPRGNRTRVLRSSFKRFLATYATIAMLVGPVLRIVWCVRKELRRRGIKPFRRKKVAGRSSEFYKRTDIEAVLKTLAPFPSSDR